MKIALMRPLCLVVVMLVAMAEVAAAASVPTTSLSCRATMQATVTQGGGGNPVTASCTLQPTPIPAGQHFVSSYLSFVATAFSATTSCELSYVAVQDGPDKFDFVPINPTLQRAPFSGAGVYPVVWDAGKAPVVTAYFSCGAGSITSFIMVTVRGQFEAQ